MEICKEVFWRFSFLTNTYYHNSICMSIAEKKIVGNPTIYFFNSRKKEGSSHLLFFSQNLERVGIQGT